MRSLRRSNHGAPTTLVIPLDISEKMPPFLGIAVVPGSDPRRANPTPAEGGERVARKGLVEAEAASWVGYARAVERVLGAGGPEQRGEREWDVG